MKSIIKIVLVVGTRPNFMKIAPLITAFHKYPKIRSFIVHTGQHYDRDMSDLFFHQLAIPEPNVNLGVGSASHAVQTAEIMRAFEPVVASEKPDAVLVVGDVNSTIACGLVAVKLGVKLIHVEAGLRSFDRTMPEEINRLLTDTISDFLFCSEPSGVVNLRREGVSEEKIFLVGNVMIDTLLKNQEKAEQSPILDDLGINGRPYVVVTLHRPSNVDDPAMLRQIVDALIDISQEMPVVFPVHPRTHTMLKNLDSTLRFSILPHTAPIVSTQNSHDSLHSALLLIDPLGYLDFLKLMTHARLVLTDSGGIQEETTILKVPCLTLRENTERPITVEMGTNRLVGTNPRRIVAAYRESMKNEAPLSQTPPLWDGRAAERIANILAEDRRFD